MPRKYVAVRFPVEAYNNLLIKKKNMEKLIQRYSRKQTNLPLTKVLIAITENPIYLSDDYVLAIRRKRKK